MSTLFDEAIKEFELENASFLSPSEVGSDALGEAEDDTVPVEPIAEFASRKGLIHPERDDWAAIPLHEPDSPELTQEYIAYKEFDDARGRLFLCREKGGSLTDVNAHSAEKFCKTELARRIRFWHADYIPNEYPDYYSYPVGEHEPPTKTVEDSSVEKIREYVEREIQEEKQANIEEAEESVYSSPDSFVELTSIGSVQSSNKTFRFSFEVPDNFQGNGFEYLVGEHGIYPDNHVLLAQPGTGSEPEPFPVEAVVEDIQGEFVVLRLNSEEIEIQEVSRVSRHLSRKRRGFRVAPIFNPLPYKRELKAIDAIGEDEEKTALLAGEKNLTFGDPRASSQEFDSELNQEQETAVRLSLLSDDCFCLHGPPGTGKTRALVEIVRRAANSGQKVLVCTDSNQAADNILVGSSTEKEIDEDSLHAYGQHGEGEIHLRRLNADNSRNGLVRRMYAGKNGSRGNVVVSTNNSAADLPSDFDLAVVDEATQSTMASTCIPVSKADRFVLAGDHKQLPPYSAQEGPAESRYGSSMFEHLYSEGGVYEGVGIQLKTQYRMHRDIMYFPNKRMYGGSLRCGRDVETLSGFDAIAGYNVGGQVHETENSSRYNKAEIEVLLAVISNLLGGQEGRDNRSVSLEASDIAVITPYEAQKNMIKELSEERMSLPSRGMSVDTVDSFQGSEREVVLISLVRSNAEGEIGFLGRPEDGPRRLNVAMTRAKRFCGIVGDWHTLSKNKEGKCSGLYQNLRSYLKDTGRMSEPDPALL